MKSLEMAETPYERLKVLASLSYMYVKMETISCGRMENIPKVWNGLGWMKMMMNVADAIRGNEKVRI